MAEYFVCFDGNNNYEESWILAADWEELEMQVLNILRELGGGHADIFDEYDGFVDDIEL